VDLGVIDVLPVPGISLLLGIDVAGGKMPERYPTGGKMPERYFTHSSGNRVSDVHDVTGYTPHMPRTQEPLQNYPMPIRIYSLHVLSLGARGQV
jgi:hypothetical protein